MSLAAGTCLGPHEVLAQIGAGGMGEVFILICTEISLVSTAMLRDDTNRDPAD